MTAESRRRLATTTRPSATIPPQAIPALARPSTRRPTRPASIAENVTFGDHGERALKGDASPSRERDTTGVLPETARQVLPELALEEESDPREWRVRTEPPQNVRPHESVRGHRGRGGENGHNEDADVEFSEVDRLAALELPET